MRPNLSLLPPKKTITKSQAIARLWQLGNLSYKLDSNQKTIYDQIKNSEDMFVTLACSRGMGKSYFMCLIAMEVCLRKPNIIVKYLAPTIKDLKNVVIPNYKMIIDDCPKEMTPTYNKADGKIIFHNGSEIHLAGTENGNAEKVRGSSAELCLVDEAGFCDDLKYTVENILYPTLTRGGSTKGKKIILASTPSRSPDHDFITYMKDAEFKGKLIKRTVYDNPRLRETAIADGYKDFEEYIVKVVAAIYPDGINSSAFKREYLCDVRVEDHDAVVPEFSTVEEDIVKPWERPIHYDGYVSMDIGFTDLTAVIFGYYDFVNAKLVINNELVLSGTQMLTDNLASLVAQKEEESFPTKIVGVKQEPFKRVADNNNPILLQDLSVKHGLTFVPTDKDNFEAALNNMRILIKTKKIIIDPKCTTLIRHLKGAIWNKQRNNFKRDPNNGHYDLVSSLIYLCRNVDFSRNPYPKDALLSNYHYTQEYIDNQKPTSEFEKTMTKILKPKFGRFRR